MALEEGSAKEFLFSGFSVPVFPGNTGEIVLPFPWKFGREFDFNKLTFVSTFRAIFLMS
jgi:hypothetical protein